MISVNLIKIALVTTMLFSIADTAISQSDIAPGARSFALGETGLGFQDIHAAYTNPAGLYGLKVFSVQASASQPFGIKELSNIQIALASVLPKGDFLYGTISSKGSSGFRQSRVSLGYGRKLAGNLSIAVEIETLMMYIRRYGSAFAFGYSISFQHKPSEMLVIGAYISNPVPVSHDRPVIPKSTLSLGLSYFISELVTINIEAFKDTRFKLRVKSGIEYIVHPAFTLRIGATTNPAQLHFGIGWLVNEHTSIDFSIGYHTLLGITPVVGIAYSGF